VTLQQSGVSAALSPKDPNLQCSTIAAARVAHYLVMLLNEIIEEELKRVSKYPKLLI